METADHHEELRNSGLKATPHRTAILDLLAQDQQPVTAEELFLRLKERDVSINLSTVYRTVETLADKDLIRKLAIIGEDRALYEYNRRTHRHYLVCLSCKKILPIERCPLGAYEKKLEDETHFRIEGHRLDIYGICPACREKGGDGR